MKRLANISRCRGFTLLELLVVIAIAVILMALLLPAITAARRGATNVTCLSNLRQWGMAVNQYAIQNESCLPRRGQGEQPTTVINRPTDWFNALPVLMNIPSYNSLVTSGRPPGVTSGAPWICPEFAGQPNSAGNLFTYGMNMRLSTWLAAVPDRIDNVGQPSTMVFMADAPGGYCSVLPFAAAFSPVARHNNRVNIAFLDGHVESLPGAYVGCGVGDPQQPDVRWIVPGSPWLGPT